MPVKLTTGKRIAETSSKGNQEKWRENGRWYKLDLFGYEGLAETVSSALLARTNLEAMGYRFVPYRMERIEVHRRVRCGCSSPNFLAPGEAIFTLSDLFRKGVGPDWQADVAHLPNLPSKVRWIVEQTVRLTGLQQFGEYLTLLFEVDMLLGNEDRHLNNIAVLRCGEGFDYCPLFDFGAGLLSNLRDYPLDIEPQAHIRHLRAQPLNTTFARQIKAARANYGSQLEWSFSAADIALALEKPLSYYSKRDASDIVVTDEVYEHIVYAPYAHTCMASLPGMYEHTITCNSLSKTYSITGWRLGYLIGPAEVIENAKKVHDFLTVGAAAPLQEAATVGLRFDQSYYDDLREKYTKKRDFFLAGLDKAGLKHNVPQGTYFVMVDIQEFLDLPMFEGYTDLEFCEWMIREVGVAAVPGSSFFHEPVNNYIRMHFAREEATLAEAIRRLCKMKEITA